MAYGYSKPKYEEIAKAPITEKRNIVVSSNSNGGFTIAQQSLVEEEDGKETWLFYKGAISIKDLEHLYNVRDCINIAIQKIEEHDADEKAWDDIINEE